MLKRLKKKLKKDFVSKKTALKKESIKCTRKEIEETQMKSQRIPPRHGKIKVPLSRRIDKERAQGGQPGGEKGVHEEAKYRISHLPCA